MKRMILLTAVFASLAVGYAEAQQHFSDDVYISNTIITPAQFERTTFDGNITIENCIIRAEAFRYAIIYTGKVTLKTCLVAYNAFYLANHQNTSPSLKIIADETTAYFSDAYINQIIYYDDVVVDSDWLRFNDPKYATFMKNVIVATDKVSDSSFQNAVIGGDLTVNSKEIERRAFYETVVGGSLVLGESVTSIVDGAFWGFFAPRSQLSLSNSIESLGTYTFSHSTFSEVVFSEDFELHKIGGFSTFYNSNIHSVTLPSSAEAIPRTLFYKCTNLKHVNFASLINLKSIGELAFCGTGLTGVSLPPSVSDIGDSAFQGCHLSTIILPKNIRSIGKWAFEETERMDYGQGAMLPPISRLIFIPEAKESQFDFRETGFNTTDKFVVWASPGNENALPLIENDYNYYFSWVYDYTTGKCYPDEATAIFYEAKDISSYDAFNKYLWDNGYHEYFATGKVYVPRGMKSFLQSLAPPTPEGIGIYSDYYPYLGILPDAHWIEIDMYDYPYCEFNPNPDGIEQIGSNASIPVEVARYDINGRLLNQPKQGVNIVRYSDGSVKKEMVK